MEGYGKRVLIVEDDDSAKDLTAMILTGAGYNVHWARDGQEALDQMKRRHFDVVVTDYHMPRLDGMAFLSLSRTFWPDTPVVMVSGDHPKTSEAAIQRGAYAWIRKPYDTPILLEIVRQAANSTVRERVDTVTFPTVG